jgi:nucleoside-diphosphate-sugar epimerase
MKILVTGSGGFLGSDICNLLSKNHQILAVSRKFTNLEINNNLICYKSEMSDYKNLDSLFETFCPDTVIHCAWMGGNSFKDINELWQIENITYGNEILKLCSKHKIKHFIGFGSSLEYGNKDSTFDEETICTPTNMYGITKNSFKMISENFCNLNEINFSWVRPVYSYGPGDIETRLIPKTILSFLRDEDLVLNKCSTLVDYLYVNDFSKAIKYIVEEELSGNYVISSDKEIEVKSIIELIYNTMKPKSKLIFDRSVADNSHQYICGTSNKLRSLTNWKPETTLENGILNTISYFKKFV